MLKVHLYAQLLSSGSVRTMLLTIAVLLMNTCCPAQTEYSVTKYTMNDYLPDARLRHVIKDKNGFYWLISSNGYMLRWNGGASFKVVNRDAQTGKTLPLFPILRYNHERGFSFLNYDESAVGLVDNDSHLWAAANKPDNLTWNLSLGGSLVNPSLRLAELAWINGPAAFSLLEEMLRNMSFMYTTFHNEGNQDVYLVDKKWNILCVSKGRIIRVVPDEPYRRAVTVGDVFVLITDNHYYLYRQGVLIGVGAKDIFNDLRWAEPFYGYSYYRDGKFTYAGTANTVYRLSVTNDQLTISPFAVLPVSFTGVNSLHVDQDGKNIMIVSWLGELYVFEKKSFHFKDVVNKGDNKAVYAFLKKDEQFIVQQHLTSRIGNLMVGRADYNLNGSVLSLPGKKLLYLSYQGFYLFDEKLNLLREIPFPAGEPIRFIVQEKEAVYFALWNLYRFDIAGEKIDTLALRLPPGVEGTLSSIAKGPPGILYAAIGWNICEINQNTLEVKKISGKLPGDNNLFIRSIVYDPVYNGLFITYLGHLVFFDLKKNAFIEFPTGDNLEILSCHYFLKDNNGDFWLPTNNGLFKIQKIQMDAFLQDITRSVTFQNMHIINDGVKEEFNGGFTNAGICSGDSVFLSCMDGILAFSTRKTVLPAPDKSNGRVIIDNITVDDLPVKTSSDIRLQPGYKRCEIAVDFPFSLLPQGSLEYQLSGIGDNAFLPVPKDNRILLRGLSPGQYHLSIRVVNYSSLEPLKITITVYKYWYKTNLAYVIYFLLICGMLYIILSWRVNRVRNASLVAVDNARKEMFAIVSHDLRSPLHAYQGMADMISSLIREKKYDKVDKIAEQIDSTGAKLDLLLNNLLKWNLLQQEKLLVKKEKVNLSELITEHTHIYIDLAKYRNLSLHTALENKVWLNVDKDMASLVIRNLLDNAIKNAVKGTVVNVRLLREGNQVALLISNVFAPAVSGKLNEVKRLMEGNQQWEPGTKGMGFGLRMVHTAVRKNNAIVRVLLNEPEVIFAVYFAQE